MTPTYLGIDIGGTASRWVAVDDNGAVVARGSAGPATGHLFNPAERERFAASMAGIAAACGKPARIHIGVTGLGPKAHADAKAIMAPVFHIAPDAVTAGDDMQLAFLAAFAPGEGHLVSAGTGSIGLHVGADGEVIRVGGRGVLVDDGGSGTWIALTALDRLYRRIDDAGEPAGMEKLASTLFDAIGGTSWDDVRAFVYGGDRGRIGVLAQAVAAAATDGDAAATAILGEAATELARLAKALIARAGTLPVAFVGGIISLHPSIKPALVAALPGVTVTFPQIDAARRAAELAREAALNTPE